MQNTDVKQTKTNPIYFRDIVSESSPPPEKITAELR